MPFPESTRLSPNFSPAPRHELLGVLVHHSVMPFEATIAHMLDPAAAVSYHVIVAPDGARCTLVPDERVAWHAGVSKFLGRSGCNYFLLGLAFAGDTYRAPLTEAQIASALEWLDCRWKRNHWTLDHIADHRQVSPGRKDDLNPAEWDRFYAAVAGRFGPGPAASGAASGG
jgi:AmpD protein